VIIRSFKNQKFYIALFYLPTRKIKCKTELNQLTIGNKSFNVGKWKRAMPMKGIFTEVPSAIPQSVVCQCHIVKTAVVVAVAIPLLDRAMPMTFFMPTTFLCLQFFTSRRHPCHVLTTLINSRWRIFQATLSEE
jgi:hypothetical protein